MRDTSSKAAEIVGTATPSRLKFLEVEDKTKSNLSHRTQIFSSSSISKLLALKAQRAPLELFADTITEQENTLTKLKLYQALGETLTRDPVYQVVLNVRDEDKDESLSQVVT